MRSYWARYREGGLEALGKDGYAGGLGDLNETQGQALEAHLREHVYFRVQEIAAYVQEGFDVAYTVSGMTDLLHCLKLVYKKEKPKVTLLAENFPIIGAC